MRGGRAVVEGHFRAEANETTLGKHGIYVENNDIPGFFDSDAGGDGVADVPDINPDGIVDSLPLDIDEDGTNDAVM